MSPSMSLPPAQARALVLFAPGLCSVDIPFDDSQGPLGCSTQTLVWSQDPGFLGVTALPTVLSPKPQTQKDPRAESGD